MVDIGRMADTLKLLGSESRLMILALLRERELCVCELVEAVEISQPAVSQHLQKLKAYDLVREERRGQWVYYSLNIDDKPFIEQILQEIPSQHDLIEKLETVCEEAI